MALIKDRNGIVIQRQETQSDGMIYAYSRTGVLVGKYDPRTNRTTDRCGRVVGTGNLLASLQ
jgi:hypothetical protein